MTSSLQNLGLYPQQEQEFKKARSEPLEELEVEDGRKELAHPQYPYYNLELKALRRSHSATS
jgi:hypothetical protein